MRRVDRCYARFGPGSFVCVYRRITDGEYVCSGCRLVSLCGDYDSVYPTPIGILSHLRLHEASGHKVLEECFERLWREVPISRVGEVWSALWHGVLPWWLYERECHYEMSYREHLWLNLRLAGRWLLFREDWGDREFGGS